MQEMFAVRSHPNQGPQTPLIARCSRGRTSSLFGTPPPCGFADPLHKMQHSVAASNHASEHPVGAGAEAS